MADRLDRHSPDFIIFFSALILLSIGIIMVFSSSAYSSFLTQGDSYYYLKRQLYNASVGVIAFLIGMFTPHRVFYRLASPFLFFSIMLLILTLFMGKVSGGAGRWIALGTLVFQPSEVVKLSMVIFFAKTLTINQKSIKKLGEGVFPQLTIVVLVCLLILAQPDLGTAVAVACTIFFMLVLSGVRWLHLLLITIAGAAAAYYAVITEPYRLRRITAYLNPYEDPIGAGFQTIQSLLALGSGGLFGMGLGNGRQKLLYIPERHTDFIYAVVGEELGFIGGFGIIVLFGIIVWRGYKVTMAAPTHFTALLAAGITIMISVQAAMNIGVVTGFLPVTGITLPFISYGGSSLVFTMAGIGVLLNISRYTKKDE